MSRARMSLAAGQSRVIFDEDEAAFQSKVMTFAKLTGWRCYHAPDNRPGRNGRVQAVEPGFPDFWGVRGPRLVVAELKREKGRMRPGQQEWLEGLALVPGVESYLWRPSSWSEIEEVLR